MRMLVCNHRITVNTVNKMCDHNDGILHCYTSTHTLTRSPLLSCAVSPAKSKKITNMDCLSSLLFITWKLWSPFITRIRVTTATTTTITITKLFYFEFYICSGIEVFFLWNFILPGSFDNSWNSFSKLVINLLHEYKSHHARCLPCCSQII